MRDTSELDESETEAGKKSSGWRGVWGVAWKLLLVLAMGLGCWLFLLSRQPEVPERWRVERDPFFSGSLGDWTGGLLRGAAVIEVSPADEEVITPEVLRWLKSERPIRHVDLRRCDFTQLSAEEMEVFDTLGSMYLMDCGMGDEQLAGLAKATNLTTLHMTNYYVRNNRVVDLQNLPTDGSLGGFVGGVFAGGYEGDVGDEAVGDVVAKKCGDRR